MITSKYDSPNVAYFCGNTYPWFYTSGDGADVASQNFSVNPVQCLVKDDTCAADNYYQDGTTINNQEVYSQYGYIDSPVSFGVSTNPFYGIFFYFFFVCFVLC